MPLMQMTNYLALNYAWLRIPGVTNFPSIPDLQAIEGFVCYY